jgi:hypothetical protein
VGEQKAGVLKGPATEVGAEGLGEAPVRFVTGLGEDRAGVTQAQRDPDRRVLAGGCFDFGDERPRVFDLVNVDSGLGEFAEQPAGDGWVVCRVGRIE